MTASPDQLPRDGSTQSIVTVVVRDDRGRGVNGQRLTLLLTPESPAGAALTATEVVTSSDGRAIFGVVAPPSGSTGGQIQVTATPVGLNADNAVPRVIAISLSGAPNATAPTPAYTFLPAAPEVGQMVSFDASTTQDEGTTCGTACTYDWNFDDDSSTESGMLKTHKFSVARSFNVALTVTDAAGTAVALRKLVPVTAVAAPSVTLAVAPSPPLVGQKATFTATATPATSHSITTYSWNFRDSTSATTSVPTVTKTYSAVGTHVVTVTVTDDRGNTGSVSLSVAVGTGITASITVSPTNPTTDTTVRFDPRSSTVAAGVTVDEYQWDFGNGETATSTPDDPVATTTFSSSRVFTVRLTIVDTAGRKTTVTTTVTVS